jgi:hypothetical protein
MAYEQVAKNPVKLVEIPTESNYKAILMTPRSDDGDA